MGRGDTIPLRYALETSNLLVSPIYCIYILSFAMVSSWATHLVFKISLKLFIGISASLFGNLFNILLSYYLPNIENFAIYNPRIKIIFFVKFNCIYKYSR